MHFEFAEYWARPLDPWVSKRRVAEQGAIELGRSDKFGVLPVHLSLMATEPEEERQKANRSLIFSVSQSVA